MKEETREEKGIDWSKNNIYDAINRPDLKPEEQKTSFAEKTCKECSTKRKVTNNGVRYLCNHFSEICDICNFWADLKEGEIHTFKPVERAGDMCGCGEDLRDDVHERV